ncbi:uncharacterized protein BcabD6B2_39870 [Babesia caballi]|uniref:Uncharacterized protein n=1 Tax=Babesia caballi TaxID=5871 RepID=A0AAV4LWI2_BABCB|nr:hypothetical protein, conserved [Babesia caballi]
MGSTTPTRRHCGSEAVSPSASTTPARRMSDSVWEEKWQAMVHHQRLRREQDALLRQKLREEQEREEYIECTFTPKTRCGYKPRSPEQLREIMKPLMLEEARILEELRKLEGEEEANVRELSRALRAHIAATQGGESEELITLCEQYREERLKELSRVKNRKLDVVGLLHEVERQYNVICVRERLREEDVARAGFSIDSCRGIKKEILDSVKGVDTLKDRSKVTAEIEAIIKRAREEAEHNRMHGHGYVPGASMGSQGTMGFSTQLPYPMLHPQGTMPGFPHVFANAPLTMQQRVRQAGAPGAPFMAPPMPAMAPYAAGPHRQTIGPNVQKPRPQWPHGYPPAPLMQRFATQPAPMGAHPGAPPQPGFAAKLPPMGHHQPMWPVQPPLLQRNASRKLQQ